MHDGMLPGSSNLLDIVDRAKNGRLVKESDFECRLLPNRLKELVAQYDIRRDPEVLVPSDNDLADSVFEAAKQLLVDLGVYCHDTGRTIKITEEDVKDSLRNLPESTTIGSGKEARELRSRAVEDKRRPHFVGGNGGGICSSASYLNIFTSMSMEPDVDSVCCGSLSEIDGKPIIGRSPVELHAAQLEADWLRKAAERAGRPGLCLIGSGFEWAGADFASFNPDWGYRPTDAGCSCMIYPMKIDFNMLAKTKHYLDRRMPIHAYSDQLIGGFTRGAEETLVSSVAHHLANVILNHATYQHVNCQHIHYNNTSNRLSIWSHNVAGQAIARNSRIVTSSECFASAGPCTEMILYEGAAVALSVVSGLGLGPGICGCVTKGMDKFTGLEERFFGKVGRACAGMKREDANDIAKQLVKKYEHRFDNPPLGKTFNECYDPESMKPSKEWLDIYNRVIEEMKDLGFSL